MQSVSAMMPYSGEGGGSIQNIFLKDTEVGWKKLQGDTSLNLSGGQSQYEYLEVVLERTVGQARKCLDN